MRSSLRILAVLDVLVALNALFVVVVLWGFLVLFPTLVAGGYIYLQHGAASFDLLRFPLSWQVTLLLIGGFMTSQLVYGYRRLLGDTGGATADDTHAVARIVRRLSMAIDIPEPAVRVVEDDRPSCYTVGRFTDATVVVTTGVIDRLDAEELEAVVAHEIAHIANRDVTLMTITTLFLEIAHRAYSGTKLVKRAVTNPNALSRKELLFIQFFSVLLVLVYLIIAPLLWLFPTIAQWATRTLSHTREFAADEAAARMTGSPLALATALTTLSESALTPETDLRTTQIQALCIVPSRFVSGERTASLPDIERPTPTHRRRNRVSSWLDGTTPVQNTDSGTHPAVEKRVERLTDIAVEMEGDA